MNDLTEVLDDLSRTELCEALARAIEKTIGNDAAKVADDVRHQRRAIWFHKLADEFGVDADKIITEFCYQVRALRPDLTIVPVGRVN